MPCLFVSHSYYFHLLNLLNPSLLLSPNCPCPCPALTLSHLNTLVLIVQFYPFYVSAPFTFIDPSVASREEVFFPLHHQFQEWQSYIIKA